jgi:hypothetical protein
MDRKLYVIAPIWTPPKHESGFAVAPKTLPGSKDAAPNAAVPPKNALRENMISFIRILPLL